MPQSYDYDESSETWPFFLLTVLLVVLVPMTAMQIYQLMFASSAEKKHEQESQLSGLHDRYTPDRIKEFRKKFNTKKSKIFNKRSLFTILGWILVSVLIQRIGSNDAIKEAASGLFDPYTLLGVATSATDKEVRSAYRKLSVKFHPDKLAKDLTQEQRSELEEQYVLITKAYKALTDEITKENYLKFGHPDGPQSTSHGIALPKFLVDGAASPLVVVCYIALLGFILPFFVSRWWSRTQSHTKKGIHVKSASYYVDRLFNYKPSEVVTVDLILQWLSHSEEFKIFYPHLTPEVFENLLHDHINRKNSGDLEASKLRIVAKSHSLLFGLLDIAAAFRNLEISNAIIDTFKCIVQATPLSPHSQILQLPNVDKDVFLSGSVDDIRTLGKLFTFEDSKIGKILGIEDEDQLKDTLAVASNIPHLKLIRAKFKVPGESMVTPLSTPHIVLKVLVRSAKHKFFEPTKIPEDMCKEPLDFDSQRDPFALVTKQPPTPQTFAPHFPVERHGGWCCLVALQKDGKIIQTPVIAQRLAFDNLSKDFDKRLIKDLDENFNPEEWEIGTIKIPLGQPAPPQKGDFFFRVIVKNTEYFGGDLDITMPLQVRDLPTVEETSDDIYGEESDEDDKKDESEGEDDSDVDDFDDDSSDYTDIDTDTEVEEDHDDE